MRPAHDFFYDDEPKPPKKPLTRRQKWLRRLAWTVAIFAVMAWTSLRLLMSLGGNGPQLGKGIENYLQQATGLRAHIGVLHFVHFFPVAGIDLADLSFSPLKAGAASLAHVGALAVQADFWDLFFSRGAVQQFEIHDLDFEDSLHLVRPLRIDRLILQKTDAQGGAAFLLDGHYGDSAISGRMSMRWRQRADGRVFFDRPPESILVLRTPVFDLEGRLSRATTGGLMFTIDKLVIGDQAVHGHILFVRGLRSSRVTGDLAGGRSRLTPDLEWTPDAGLSGKMSLPILDLDDTALFSALATAFGQLIPSSRVAHLAGLVTVHGTVKIDDLRRGAASLGDITMPVRMAGGAFAAVPVTGHFAGGAVDGEAALGFSGDRILFGTKGHVTSLKMAATADAATAKFFWSLHGSAVTLGAVGRSANGEAALVSAGGSFTPAALPAGWQPALGAILLPETTHLNCLLADFAIADGQAVARPLRAETMQRKLLALGSVNFLTDRIDLTVFGTAGEGGQFDKTTIHGPPGDYQIEKEHLTADDKAAAVIGHGAGPVFQLFSAGDLGLTTVKGCGAAQP